MAAAGAAANRKVLVDSLRLATTDGTRTSHARGVVRSLGLPIYGAPRSGELAPRIIATPVGAPAPEGRKHTDSF